MTWAENLLIFYRNIHPAIKLPHGISWLYPQKEEPVMKIVEQFLSKYYNDSNKRILMLGINPGRFGAGVTGVNFTAAKQLTEKLDIEHSLKMQSELSAEFIYMMIEKYGGAKKFYKDVFISSVCPLGFIEKGKNINYYDNKELLKAVEPFIIQTINVQLTFNVNTETCFCIGGEKNFKYLSKLNDTYGWFSEIIPVPHPRFIMQYKRKKADEFAGEYVRLLKEAKKKSGKK